MDKEMLKKDFADFTNVIKTAKGKKIPDIAKSVIKTLTGKAACALVALVLVIGIAKSVGGSNGGGGSFGSSSGETILDSDVDELVKISTKNNKKSLKNIPNKALKAPEESTRKKLENDGWSVEFLNDNGCKLKLFNIWESKNYLIPAKVEGEPVVEVYLDISLGKKQLGIIHSVSFSDKLTTLKRFDSNGADIVIYNDNIKTLFENNPIEYFYCSAVLLEDLVIPAAAQKAATKFVIADRELTKEWGLKFEEGWEKISFVSVNKNNPEPSLELVPHNTALIGKFFNSIEFPSTLKEIVYASYAHLYYVKYKDDKERVHFNNIKFIIPDSLGTLKWTPANTEDKVCNLFENRESTNEENTYISKEDQEKLRRIGYEGPFVKDPNEKDDSLFGFF